MKVVLFCGGFGMRMREFSETIPKPMVKIGYRPIIWHVMKYYAHFGHKDFILCLGWQGNVIKDYFLNYDECVSNDFTLTNGGRDVELINTDIKDWSITFVETGTTSCIGERLRRVAPHLQGEEHFLANYSDGLTDLNLNLLIDQHLENNATASFLSVPPTQSFHTVLMDESGKVSEINQIGSSDVWMNGGYFVLSNEIFNYMNPDEELVEEPFERLIAEQRLSSLRYDGFWSCMDTYKEMSMLHELYEKGDPPWAVWRNGRSSHPVAVGKPR